MLNQVNEQKISQLIAVLNVLADPVCIRIILSLTRPTSLNTLVRNLQVGQNTLLHHLARMQANGLLIVEHSGEEVYYSLPDRALWKAVKSIAV